MSDKQGGSKPEKTVVDTTASSEPGGENGAGDDLDEKSEVLSAESLGRYLATEASLREESEQRTSTVLARYLKLTLVMACLNMVVAGASVAALLGNRRAQPVVIAPPVAAPAPAPVALPPAPEKAPVVVQPAALPAEPPTPPAPSPAVSPPAKIPLLGPLAPTPKYSPAVGTTRVTRVASRPLPSPPAPVALARNADDEEASSAHRAVERW